MDSQTPSAAVLDGPRRMIARSRSPRQGAAWRRELARAVTDPAELLALLGLPEGLLPAARRAAQDFPLRVPRGFVARMTPGDPHDPLLRQVLPLGEELGEVAGYSADPLAEAAAAASPGVLHKYRGRALLVLTGACGVHCRYCFRRHFPYENRTAGAAGFAPALDYLAADPSIDEVILSGGDPLLLPDDRLAELARALADIPHLKRLRVHSRTPVVLPERVDAELLGWLAGGRLKPVMVIHANHPREVDAAVAQAMGELEAAGVTLLNQTVLLAGVNDSAETLVELSQALFDGGVMPYYLHLLDPVAGAAHFAVGEGRAQKLAGELAARLPGYLVPRLVREVPGMPAKVPVMPDLGAAG